ncbi:hypothetical protein [uncultured Cohaesibacter sp.]|uniref:hypothetical protein n=1 Tax=uncultured Cohaesibacter sp. TaxID=1002546 RepID=UPI0029316391|nr:hypothetical protein [uncultured Cohaesibacter sp.]
MKKFLHSTALLVTLSTGTALADGTKRLDVYGFDASDSVAINVDHNVARAAGNTIEKMIAELAPGDQVKLRSFGTAGIADQQININITLGKKPRTRPNKIAPQVGHIVRSLPRLAASGEFAIQPRTNIIGFVERIAPTLDCQNQTTRLILLTDGIEWSSQVRGDHLLMGKAELPPPSGPILKGCSVVMLGVGQQSSKLGTDSRWFPFLKKKWEAFFMEAGAAKFTAYATFE